MFNRRQWGRAAAGLMLGVGQASVWAQAANPRLPAVAPPKLVDTRIVIALDQRISLGYLPLTIAAQLGYFRDEGLDVELREFADPAQAMAAVATRGAHVLCGPFIDLLAPPARSQGLQAFVVQGRAPQVVLGASIKTLNSFSSAADLRGKRIGVRLNDNACQQVLRLVTERAGLRDDDVQVVMQPNPQAALQAFRNGQIDALCFTDPTITQLEQLGELRVVADTRSLRGTADVFGGPMPSGCLSAPGEFLTQFPRLTQALTDAMVHALKWLQTAGPSDLIKTVPEHHFQGDRSLYLAAFERAREAWTPDGLMPRLGPETAARVAGGEAGRTPAAELARAFTNVFALKSKARFRA